MTGDMVWRAYTDSSLGVDEEHDASFKQEDG